MSIDDVKSVRDAIMNLYMEHGDYYRTTPPRSPKEGAIPRRHFGVSEVRLYGANVPGFEWDVKCSQQKTTYRAWLKFKAKDGTTLVKEGVPYWDFQVAGKDWHSDIEQKKFNDAECRLAAELFKVYLIHFPFPRTDNFLQNDGRPVA